MQQALLFTQNQTITPLYGQFGPLDERRKAYEESFYTKWHCIKTILSEQYLWDMRYWDKPKSHYSKLEIMMQISKWIKDHREGNWTSNCGHCLYCIRKLLALKWATPDEIAGYILRNNNITYHNQIGTWKNGFEE